MFSQRRLSVRGQPAMGNPARPTALAKATALCTFSTASPGKCSSTADEVSSLSFSRGELQQWPTPPDAKKVSAATAIQDSFLTRKGTTCTLKHTPFTTEPMVARCAFPAKQTESQTSCCFSALAVTLSTPPILLDFFEPNMEGALRAQAMHHLCCAERLRTVCSTYLEEEVCWETRRIRRS